MVCSHLPGILITHSHLLPRPPSPSPTLGYSLPSFLPYLCILLTSVFFLDSLSLLLPSLLYPSFLSLFSILHLSFFVPIHYSYYFSNYLTSTIITFLYISFSCFVLFFSLSQYPLMPLSILHPAGYPSLLYSFQLSFHSTGMTLRPSTLLPILLLEQYFRHVLIYVISFYSYIFHELLSFSMVFIDKKCGIYIRFNTLSDR